MRKFVASIVSILVCLSGAQLGSAQDTQPQPTGAVIRTSVQEVVLDLVVRDSKGKIVKNLQQNEVEILEDGVKQDIRSFRLIQGRDVFQQEKGQSAKATVSKAAGNPLHAVNLVCIVFHNLDAYTKRYAVEAATEFIKNDMTEDTWVAIFNLDSRLTVLHEFTRDKSALLEAANHAFTGTTINFVRVADAVLASAPNIATIETTVNGNPAAGGSVSSAMVVTGGEMNNRAIGDASTAVDAASNAQRGDLVGQRLAFSGIEGQRETDSVLAMITQFNTLPGRKSVLLMSPGMATTGDADMFKMIVDKANKAAISVYAVDVNGLQQNSNGLAANAAVSYAAGLSSQQGANSSTGAGMREKMRESDYIGNAVRTSDTQASLRGLSEGTGGFLIGSTNDFRKPFQKMVEDVETHYEVIYHPSSVKYDGHLRTIDVKLARTDLSVSSRTGYFAMPYLGNNDDPALSDMLGLAALNVKTPPHAFEYRAAALEFRPEASSSVNAAVIELPTKGLTFTADQGTGKYRMHVSVLGLIKDSKGEVVDKFTQDTPYFVDQDKLAAAQNTTLSFTHPLNLPQGRYTMDTAIVDRESNRAAIKKVGFGSQEKKGVGLSSVMLVKRVEPVNDKTDKSDPFEFQAEPGQARRIVPELATHFAADAQPSVFFVVYPDPAIAEKPKVQVAFLVGGKLIAKQESDLPAPDSTGAIPVLIQAAKRPGDCELRVTATQGNTGTLRTVSYTIGAPSDAAAPPPAASAPVQTTPGR
jgi:VWFA-related protein